MFVGKHLEVEASMNRFPLYERVCMYINPFYTVYSERPSNLGHWEFAMLMPLAGRDSQNIHVGCSNNMQLQPPLPPNK